VELNDGWRAEGGEDDIGCCMLSLIFAKCEGRGGTHVGALDPTEETHSPRSTHTDERRLDSSAHSTLVAVPTTTDTTRRRLGREGHVDGVDGGLAVEVVSCEGCGGWLDGERGVREVVT
jgi:hypothetical protein